MKFISIICSLFLVITVTLSPVFATEETLNTPSNMLILGDSISSGYGLDNYSSGRENTNNYSNILSKKYGIEDNLTNLAIDGQTSAELLEKLKNGEYDELLASSDCVITSIGGNDLLHYIVEVLCQSLGIESFDDFQNIDMSNPAALLIGALSGLTSEETTKRFDEIVAGFEQNFAEISALMREKAPNANIIFLTIYNPFDQSKTFTLINPIAVSILEKLNNVVRAGNVSNSNLYSVADLYTGFNGMGSDLTNIEFFDIHPNSGGHEMIAELCMPIVESFEYTIADANSDVSALKTKAVILISTCFAAIFVLIILYIVRNLHEMRPPKNKTPKNFPV